MSLENSPSFLLNFSEWDVNGENGHFYRFKSFRLDVEERRLLQHNTKVMLTPKAFDVLAVLVERSGHLVEKHELLRIVWADSFVEEANIARIIHTLRKALGDDGNGNKFIETVPKKGYRFVTKVNTHCKSSEPKTENDGQNAAKSVGMRIAAESPVPSSAEGKTIREPVIIPKDSARILLFTAGLVCGFLLFLILITDYPSLSVQPAASLPKVKTIAVLPLKPVNAADRDEIYEIGIADSLIQRISSIKGFVVRPLSATRKYAGIEQDALAAGREQQVDYVITADYQLADGKVRVAARLFNVANGVIENTYQGEKSVQDVFAMQDAVAGELGNVLLERSATAASLPAIRRGTTNEEAYRLYLLGKSLTARRNPEDTAKAIDYFEQAIRLDPNFARAYSAKAQAFITAGIIGSGFPREEFEKAKTAVTRALELDGNLGEGYRVLGDLKHIYEWDSAGAEKAWRRGFEREPHAESRYPGYLAMSGRFDEALAAIETMLAADPNSLALQRDRGLILYLARRYDEAIVQLKRVLELDENYAHARGVLKQAYEMKGDQAGAYEEFIKLQKRANPAHLALYQKLYETAGWQAVKHKWLAMEKKNENKPAANYYRLARLSALLGKKEQAFGYLHKSVEKRQGQLRMLKVEPYFDSLRDDARFHELVRRVGLS